MIEDAKSQGRGADRAGEPAHLGSGHTGVRPWLDDDDDRVGLEHETGAAPEPGTVNWAGKPMNAAQLAAELARTGVNRQTWIGKHLAAAQTLGWA